MTLSETRATHWYMNMCGSWIPGFSVVLVNIHVVHLDWSFAIERKAGALLRISVGGGREYEV